MPQLEVVLRELADELSKNRHALYAMNTTRATVQRDFLKKIQRIADDMRDLSQEISGAGVEVMEPARTPIDSAAAYLPSATDG